MGIDINLVSNPRSLSWAIFPGRLAIPAVIKANTIIDIVTAPLVKDTISAGLGALSKVPILENKFMKENEVLLVNTSALSPLVPPLKLEPSKSDRNKYFESQFQNKFITSAPPNEISSGVRFKPDSDPSDNEIGDVRVNKKTRKLEVYVNEDEWVEFQDYSSED